RAESAEFVRRLEERTREAERASQAARRSERELALLRLYNENLVNSLRSAIVVTDAAGMVTGFNRAARSLLAMRDEQIGRPMEELPLHAAAVARAGADEVRGALSGRVLRLESVSFPSPAGPPSPPG